MFNKFLLVLCALILSFSAMCEEKSINVEMTITPLEPKINYDGLTLQGMKKAISAEIELQGGTPELFWKKLEEKRSLTKMTAKEIMELLKIFFNQSLLEVPSKSDEKEAPVEKETLVEARFKYDINSEKVKSLVQQLMSDLPDPAEKSFFIMASIDIDSSLSWEDVGVTKAENFSGVIKESWKKLAMESFKGFDHYVVLNKELPVTPDINSKSMILKWKSQLKKTFEEKDQKMARYELTAQYVLVNAKTGDNLVAFDFPVQKREFSTANTKSLSSSLASLIYNLLNSQASKISGLTTQALTSREVVLSEYKITGTHGLSDLYQAISYLNEVFKEKNLVVELKSYSNPGSTLIVKFEDSARAGEILSGNGGRYAFNEQKILVFNPGDKTFAIISKDGNN